MSLGAIAAEQNPWWRSLGARAAKEHPAKRDFQRRVSDFARSEERRALVILGPRQVGKTVALRQLIDELLDENWPAANLAYFDFSDDRLVERASPREIVAIKPVGLIEDKPRVVLLDEINRANRWQDWLKRVVDSEPLLRVVATGSIAGALRAGARESGQGRWDEIRVGTLTYGEHLRFHAALRGVSEQELIRNFPNEMERYLELGGFPEHVRETDIRRSRSRIREDIADRAIARDLADTGVDVEGVRRLFVYLATQSGAIFSPRERSRDLGVDERSVKNWVDHLLDAQLVALLNPLPGRGSARLRRKPRIYAADHGMVGAFAASPDRRHDPEIFARVVETTVFRQLRDTTDEPRETIHYFRNHDDLEADFVIATNRDPVIVEVTSSREVKTQKLRRVQDVGTALGSRSLAIIYSGITAETRDGVRIIPLEDFLLRPEQIGIADV